MMKKILILLTLALCLNTKAQVCFNPQAYYASAGKPESIVSTDFNNDGFKDLAVATEGAGGYIPILLGTGTGSFGPTTSLSIGGNLGAIISADFNGDGQADIAVTDYASTNIRVLLGTGTGSFGAATSFTVSGNGTVFITSADFNGDGKADLVASSNGYSNIYVLLNTSTNTVTATFGAATSYTVETSTQYAGINSITTADFNGDGELDLATANTGTANHVSVLLGTGTGSFGNPIIYTTAGTNPFSIISADFNGDGKADLAVTDQSSADVSVLLNTTTSTVTATFSSAISYTVGVYPTSVTSADFDGDGKLDLATANKNSNNVSVLLGTSTGSFGLATNFAADSKTYAIVSADFNGDGKVDLAVTNDNASDISVLINCNTTGIEQNNLNTTINVYPNPANDNFVIESSNLLKETLQVYDVNGKLVLSQNLNVKTYIDTRGLSDGIYNLSIISNQGVVNKKIVILR